MNIIKKNVQKERVLIEDKDLIDPIDPYYKEYLNIYRDQVDKIKGLSCCNCTDKTNILKECKNLLYLCMCNCPSLQIPKELTKLQEICIYYNYYIYRPLNNRPKNDYVIIPDTLLNLKTILIDRYDNFNDNVIIPSSLSIEELIIQNCNKINKISSLPKASSFTFGHCNEIKEICPINEEITLNLNNCGFKEINNAFKNVKELVIESCHNIKRIPNYINLKSLYISNCSIINIPDTLINLEYLKIEMNIALKEIPKTLLNLKKLYIYNSYYSENVIKEIPNTLLNLKELDIYNCDIKEIPDTLINIEKINLHNCNNIKTIPKTFINLKVLSLYNCDHFNKIPKTLINLTDIYISYCNHIRKIPKEFINLTGIEIYNNKKIFITKKILNKPNISIKIRYFY